MLGLGALLEGTAGAGDLIGEFSDKKTSDNSHSSLGGG